MGIYNVQPGDNLDSPKAQASFSQACMILLAWEVGELSEGQACSLVGVDPLTLRGMRQGALDAAEALWEQYRRKDPPER